MHIHGPHDGLNLDAKSLRRSSDSPKGQRIDSQAAAANSATDIPHAAEHTSAPEIVQLVSRLHAIPEVREHRIAEIAERLSRGEYLTRDAAERTAALIAE
ncbi:MAG: hypothetical protein WBF93_02355 [Pirellulales bacterium]|nr:hypothetical protein [Pirellulales bacterium]